MKTQKQFELSLETAKISTFDYLISFLEKRCIVLESIMRYLSGISQQNRNSQRLIMQ